MFGRFSTLGMKGIKGAWLEVRPLSLQGFRRIIDPNKRSIVMWRNEIHQQNAVEK